MLKENGHDLVHSIHLRHLRMKRLRIVEYTYRLLELHGSATSAVPPEAVAR